MNGNDMITTTHVRQLGKRREGAPDTAKQLDELRAEVDRLQDRIEKLERDTRPVVLMHRRLR